MQASIHSCLFALAVGAAIARTSAFEQPITSVQTSFGKFNHERVTFIRADIYPRHLKNKDRVNFPRTAFMKKYFNEAKAPGDERGHLVAAQFSGPPQWYNLSPQNARVNRNAGYQSITTDWYKSECEVRQFLQQGGNRHVVWNVHMSYVADSNRPDKYHLQVEFILNGRVSKSIDTLISNPFLREDSTFWICRQCRSNRCSRA